MTPVTNQVCLRQGYNCTCEFCLPWIAKWDREVNGFVLFQSLLNEDRSLFYIFERMRPDHHELLRMYENYLEETYINHKREQQPLSVPTKRKSPSTDVSEASSSNSFKSR